MLFTLLLRPLEIFGDPFGDLLCFSRAESVNQPFEGIAIILTVVATADSLTGWHNIVRCISPFFCHWYPMILRKGMPQSFLASAIGARMIEVFQATLPIIQRESRWQRALPGISSFMSYVILSGQTIFVWMILDIITFFLAHFVWFSFASKSSSFSYLYSVSFYMFSIAASRLFSMFLWILIIISFLARANQFTMITLPLAIVGVNLLAMSALVLPISLKDFLVILREIGDRKSTRLNSSHQIISYAVFCLKKKKKNKKLKLKNIHHEFGKKHRACGNIE